MATPAAVLSILVDANTTEATSKLSKFDRQLATVNDTAKKGIEARLGANYNPQAFTKYEDALDRATRRAKDRAAFRAELGANFNPAAFNSYERQIDKASRTTQTAAKHTERLSHSVRGLASSLLAAGGAFAAYQVGKNAIDTTLQLGHATERLSGITGLDIKTASEWIEVMKVRGIQAKAVSMSFITLSRQVRTAQDADTSHVAKIKDLLAAQKLQRDSLAATGASHQRLAALQQQQQAALDKLSGPSTNKAIAAFTELGVSQDTLRSKNTEQVLLAVAAGLGKITDPMRRAAIAQQLFGRGSQALIPILAQGKKGVDELLGSANKYGAFLPNNTKQLAGAVTAQRNLNLAMDGLKITFTRAVLPVLVQGADKLMGFIAQMRSGKGAGGEFARIVGRAFRTVKGVVKDFVDIVGGVKPALEIAAGGFVASKLLRFSAGFARDIGTGVSALRSVPRLLGRLTGINALSKLGGAGAQTVGEMTVDMMIVKSMIGGGAGGLPGEPTPAGGKASLFERLTGGTSALAALGAAAPYALPLVIASQFATPTAGQQATRAATGLQGLLSPNQYKALQANLGGLTATGKSGNLPFSSQAVDLVRQANAALKSFASTGNARGLQAITDKAQSLAKQFPSLRDGMRLLETAMRNAANRGAGAFGKLPLALGAALVKSQSATSNGVKGIVDKLKDLAPRARAQAALAMIEMSQELERKGALPKGTTARLSKEIAGPLKGIGITSKTSAGQVRQLRSAIASLPDKKTINFNLDFSSNFQQLGKELASQFAFLPKLQSQPAFAGVGHLLNVHGHTLGAFPGAGGVPRVPIAHTHETAAQRRAAQAADKQHAAAVKQAAAAAAQKAAAARQAAAAKAAAEAARKQAIYLAFFARIPSQGAKEQIRSAQIANRLTLATNSGNVGGQQSALGAERRLDKQWVAEDKRKLQKVNRQLARKGLSRSTRNALIQDKLALIQEIGTVEADIGSVASSLAGLASGGTGSGTTGFDLAPGSVTLPTAYDVKTAIKSTGAQHHHHGDIHLHIEKGSEEKVIDMIDRTLNSQIHSRLRRAGMRGT